MKSKNNGTIRKIISKNTDTIYKYTIIFKAFMYEFGDNV